MAAILSWSQCVKEAPGSKPKKQFGTKNRLVGQALSQVIQLDKNSNLNTILFHIPIKTQI